MVTHVAGTTNHVHMGGRGGTKSSLIHWRPVNRAYRKDVTIRSRSEKGVNASTDGAVVDPSIDNTTDGVGDDEVGTVMRGSEKDNDRSNVSVVRDLVRELGVDAEVVHSDGWLELRRYFRGRLNL